MDSMNKLRLVFGDNMLGVHGQGFRYVFSYFGGLDSLVIQEKEWLYRSPRPTFWRAVTDNDRGNRFHLRSGMWYAADMFLKCASCKVWVDGEAVEPLPIAPYNNSYDGTETARTVKLLFTYETITVPSTKVEITYEVNTEGEILVAAHYFGQKGLPQLPVFGMRFIMPTKAIGYEYEGLSGETYPDRMAGGIPGVYQVEGLPVTPYMVPQDCGMHMDTKWLQVVRNSTLSNIDKSKDNFALRFEAVEKNFAFACLPYTAQELENATHHEELPPARRTVVTILGAVRGVGGMDSWGADVEPQYHISGEKDIEYCFKISIGAFSVG